VTEPDVVITLVHGTFASWSGWPQSDGQFATLLRKRLPGLQTHVQSVQWSGWFSGRSRQKGAERVASRLDRATATWPNSRHYLIGHSHGGAVAMFAVDKCLPAARDKVAGVATISTPFIVVRPLPTHRAAIAETLRRFLLLVMPAAFAAVAVEAIRLMYQADRYSDREILAVTAVLLLLAIFAARSFSVRIARWATELADRSSALLASRVPDGIGVLIVRAMGDEASAFLSLSQLAARLLRIGWAATLCIARPITEAIRWTEKGGRWVPPFLSSCGFFYLIMYSRLAMASGPPSDFSNPRPDMSVWETLCLQVQRALFGV
jgi:pimeloyl-ACP methyl ester carboxylesterase